MLHLVCQTHKDNTYFCQNEILLSFRESTCADPEGGQGSGPPPLENHKNIVFLSHTVLDPMKNHKIQNSMSGHYHQAIETSLKWCFAGGPMIVPLIMVIGSSPLLKKCFLDPRLKHVSYILMGNVSLIEFQLLSITYTSQKFYLATCILLIFFKT